MIKDSKYSVNMEKFMMELRRYMPRCRECTVRRKSR